MLARGIKADANFGSASKFGEQSSNSCRAGAEEARDKGNSSGLAPS